jgi:hypothetical protein
MKRPAPPYAVRDLGYGVLEVTLQACGHTGTGLTEREALQKALRACVTPRPRPIARPRREEVRP